MNYSVLRHDTTFCRKNHINRFEIRNTYLSVDGTLKKLQLKGYSITHEKKPSIAKSAEFINISSAAGTTG